MDTILLNNNIEMPMLGIGTKGLNDPDICEQVVLYSLKEGYRLIDSAPLYHNENAIGLALSETDIPREDIFITSKIIPTSYHKSLALKSIEKTLNRLRIDQLDLLLLQSPQIEGWKNAWKMMEKAVDMHLVRSIGVCNFYLDNQIDELCSMANIAPVVDQVECHPFFQQHRLRKKLIMENIRLEAWYPLGHGNPFLINNTILMDIATKHHTTICQVILKWHIQVGNIIIPRSSNPYHIQRNFHLGNFSLDPEDMKKIASLDVGYNFYRVPKAIQKLQYWVVR
ncbi:MAG: aldo/keto reductase [Butyrivibrio sp.]|nr:aldo/keto reductase [Butyrivibrio sp.]